MRTVSPFQAKYYAYQLTKRCPSDTPEKLSAILSNAQVDLNPHQIDAALFAFKSPLSKGAILADEVGLGKTIEAGILIAQKWAERKKKLLIIVPSSLRSQWSQELLDKFYLPSIILEAKSFNQLIKQGVKNPFDQNKIIICSYHFARNKEEYVERSNWDLVVLDEAHKLRNVYRTDNKIGKSIKHSLEESKKVLLTATPLQNSLLELYGLVSIIDEHIFGDLKSYKSQFARIDNDTRFIDLKERLKPICKRHLRRNIQEYINYKNRIPITIEFIPTDDEQVLYEMVSEYLRRENLQALPKGQRHLMILILRKLLASSTYAISRTLDMLAKKLKKKLKDATIVDTYDDIIEDFSAAEEVCDEWDDNDNEAEVLTKADVKVIESEIAELEAFRDLAESIVHNAKGEKLKTALEQGFAKARELGGREKALIFTESVRTQQYLNRILQQVPEFKDKIVLFSGSNSDEKSKKIFADWLEKYNGTDVITDSRTSNIRSSIIDYFKNEAKIMISTEAGAEGINLQFCSLVVNYDLPWNPQRIEQRIGRCHRYGQEFDVVVVNFVNKANKADQRVFELLRDKFQLFSGVFGASDEVLGVIESGVDFEKRIAGIYQSCRTKEQIQEAFDKLQAEMDEKIATNMKSTRAKLFDHFDDEVIEKLKVTRKDSEIYLNRYEQWLWAITQFGLKRHAVFNHNAPVFHLKTNPFTNIKIPTGIYKLKKNVTDAYTYRIGHPLAQALIQQARKLDTPEKSLTFDYTNTQSRISILEALIGKQGHLAVYNFTVSALEDEDYIIHAGITDDGKLLDSEQCMRLLSIPVKNETRINGSLNVNELDDIQKKKQSEIIDDIAEKNAEFFEEEMDKLDKWAEDKKKSLEIHIKDLDIAIKQQKTMSRKITSLEKKVDLQRKIKVMEKKRTDLRRKLFDAQDEIEKQKDNLLDEIEAKMRQQIKTKELFQIHWKLV